jgi:protein phosphatase
MSEEPSNSASGPAVTAAGLSDIGQVRKINQDRLLLLPERGLYIVADGMGGHRAGEVASQIVIEVLPRLIAQELAGANPDQPPAENTLNGYDSAEKLSDDQIEHAIQESIIQISQQLYRTGLEDGSLRGMGTTVALAYLRGRRLHLANMGDSRIYRLRSGHLEQLNQDHSVTAILVKLGEIKPEDAASHPAHGTLSRFVGMPDVVDPDVWTDSLRPGDTLLLCSDGLSGKVPDEQITELLKANPTLEDACRVLVETANQAGGEDNITAVLLHFG